MKRLNLCQKAIEAHPDLGLQVSDMRDLSRIAEHAESLHVAGDGMTRVADLQTRRRATIKGTIYSVILRPRSGVLALEIEIEDGTGRVRCIWLGRRTIHGLTAGRDIVVTALFTRDKQTWVGFNPMYQLMPNAQ